MDQEIVDALRKPSDFAYYGDNEEMFVTWGFFGPTIHRDSDILEESNYYTVLDEINELFPNDFELVSCSHWAVGWMEHIAIRVLDENDEPTKIFNYMKGVSESLADYPILDENDFSRREYDDAIGTIEFISPAFEFNYKNSFYDVKENLPDDWANQVFSYLFDSHSYCSSSEYSDEDIYEAFIELGYAERII